MAIGSSDGSVYEDGLELTLDHAFKQFSKGQQTNFETPLNAQEEKDYQVWKQKYAPNDSGQDYDLRGAFLDGLTPDPQTGHFGDKFKKPTHPTFSDQSKYFQDAPFLAGSWSGPDGETYTPGMDRTNVPLEQLPSIDVAVETPSSAKPSAYFENVQGRNKFLSSFASANNSQGENSPDVNRTLYEKLTGSDGKTRYQLWPEKMVRSFIDSLALPGDVYHGKVDLNSPEGVSRATELALNLGIGGIMTAPLKPGVGMFGGKYTKDAVNLAKKMESEGFSSLTIKEMTGLERGAEGMWRREFSDAAATIDQSALKKAGVDGFPDHDVGTLGKVLNHKELYEAYPEAKDIVVVRNKQPGGEASPTATGVYISEIPGVGPAIVIKSGMPDTEVRKTLLHEVQHYIQDVEGFAAGTTHDIPKHIAEDLKVDFFLTKRRKDLQAVQHLKEAFEETGNPAYQKLGRELVDRMIKEKDYNQYARLSNEVEARNVETRADMSSKSRRQMLAKDSEDVARGEQIVLDMADVYLGSPFKMESKGPPTTPTRMFNPANDNKNLQIDSDRYLEALIDNQWNKMVKDSKKPDLKVVKNDNAPYATPIQEEYAKMYEQMNKPNLRTVPEVSKATPLEAAEHYRYLVDKGQKSEAYKFEEAFKKAHGNSSWTEGQLQLFKKNTSAEITPLERDLLAMENAVKIYNNGKGSDAAIKQVMAEREWTLGHKGLAGEKGEIEFFDPLGHPHWIKKESLKITVHPKKPE